MIEFRDIKNGDVIPLECYKSNGDYNATRIIKWFVPDLPLDVCEMLGEEAIRCSVAIDAISIKKFIMQNVERYL